MSKVRSCCLAILALPLLVGGAAAQLPLPPVIPPRRFSIRAVRLFCRSPSSSGLAGSRPRRRRAASTISGAVQRLQHPARAILRCAASSAAGPAFPTSCRRSDRICGSPSSRPTGTRRRRQARTKSTTMRSRRSATVRGISRLLGAAAEDGGPSRHGIHHPLRAQARRQHGGAAARDLFKSRRAGRDARRLSQRRR